MLYEVITPFSVKSVGPVRMPWISNAPSTMASGGVPGIRITSYNVCYTKLLRPRRSGECGLHALGCKWHGAQAHTRSIEHGVSDRPRHGGRHRLTDAERRLLRSVYQYYLYRRHLGKCQQRIAYPINRITSYNVCYTKLLRIVFKRISTGAANDIKQATDLAQQMIRSWGMSDELSYNFV